jgi:hypothetical protein
MPFIVNFLISPFYCYSLIVIVFDSLAMENFRPSHKRLWKLRSLKTCKLCTLTSTGFFFPLKFLLLHSEANWVSGTLSTQIVLVGGRKSELASQYFSMALSISVQWFSVDPFAILISELLCLLQYTFWTARWCICAQGTQFAGASRCQKHRGHGTKGFWWWAWL